MFLRTFLLAILLSLTSQFALAEVATPCGVTMVQSAAVSTGLSSLTPAGPVILYSPTFFLSLGPYGPPMFRYMQAHECAHHADGDVVAGMMNPLGMMMINPQIEIRADCGAARTLKAAGDTEAVQVAENYWARYGNFPTGPNYPTGIQRAQTLASC